MIKGLTAKNWKLKLFNHPCEDSYRISQAPRIIAVADGVTRDPSEYLPRTKLQFVLQYPYPSPAKIAAHIACNAFVQSMQNFTIKDEKAVRKSIEESNKRIKSWNDNNLPFPDYLTEDFAGCVFAGTVQEKDLVHWGYLCDCGVAIFDEKGNLRFRTADEGPAKHDKYIWQDPRLQGIGWRNPKARKIIRKDYRNNPSQEHSFGVLTGEDTAMHYVKTGTEELKPNESLIVYSDGLENIIFSNKFAEALRKRSLEDMSRLCKRGVRTEGTIVYSI